MLIILQRSWRDSRLGCPGPSGARPVSSQTLRICASAKHKTHPALSSCASQLASLMLKTPRAEEAFTVSRLVESESLVAPASAQPQEIAPREVRLRNDIGRHIKPAIPFWQAAILAALSLWLYGPTIYHLVLQWAATDSDFSHGFFVPLFSAFVLWQERRRLSEIILQPGRAWRLWLLLSASSSSVSWALSFFSPAFPCCC